MSNRHLNKIFQPVAGESDVAKSGKHIASKNAVRDRQDGYQVRKDRAAVHVAFDIKPAAIKVSETIQTRFDNASERLPAPGVSKTTRRYISS